jgi:hypothetical protein
MLKPPTLAEPAPPPPPIDQGLRDRALEKFRGLARGNGVKPEAVELAVVEAQTLRYQAQAYVRLATQYTSQTLPGKIEKGEAIGDPRAFDAALKSMTTGTQKDAGRRQTIIDAVLRRADKGYGAREQVIKFDSLAKDYVSHEACPACAQKGKTECTRCKGSKAMTCQKCHGRHSILCPTCRGTGQTFNSGKALTCTKCKGRNRIQCPTCAGNGQVKCKGCQGTGIMACAPCKATGFVSHLAHVELIGHLHFDYDRQGLPRELTKLLDAFYARYIDRKDIALAILTPEYNEAEPPENIPIGYEVTVPYGEVTFALPKNRRVRVTLLGQNAEFIKGDEFLDALTRRGQEELAAAAGGQGDVGENLRSAARFRMIRESIIAAASNAPQRVSLSKLQAKYPVGIAPEKLLRFMVQAEAAMKIVTRKPQLTGLSAGMLVYILLASAYFILLREALPPRLGTLPVPAPVALAAMDATMGVLGVLLGLLGGRIVATRTLRQTLKGLASQSAIEQLKPRFGWTLWASFLVSGVVTGIFHFLAIK